MRITQSQLRRIIKEEISKIYESEESDQERILSAAREHTAALIQKVRAEKELISSWLPSVSPDQMVTVTEKPIKKIRDTSRLCEIAEKPEGIWYAPGEAWINYLKFDVEMLEEARYVYSLQPVYSQGGLESRGGILQISSPDMLYEFNRRFAVKEDPAEAAALDALVGRAPRKLNPPIFTDVNWPAVAKIWDGIEISPHQLEVARDIQVQWYVGWDIASGCIWRPAGVQNIQLLATRN